MATYTVTFTINDPKEGEPFEQDILDAVNSSPLRMMANTWSMNKVSAPPRISYAPRVHYGPEVQD